MEIITIACIASVILAALALFQLSLALGAPIGRFAWGGQYTVLPTRLRIASAVSILMYAFFAGVILTKVGVVSLMGAEATQIIMWVLVGYFLLGILMNAISRSKSERALMTPTAAVLAVLFWLVAVA